ncbi:MAG: signal peptide peptidase SppA [Caldisericia bacterium]|nr:signal peptide peptidase SppA [Caldisericia bacterium]HXK70067.1 signal peptide peptidase SppA [Caldisericia bacterium]
MKRNKIGGIIFTIFIIVVIAVSIIQSNRGKVSVEEEVTIGKGNNISLIELEGTIAGSSSLMGDGIISPQEVDSLLNEVKKDSSTALIISINSPGGSVEPTQEIYNSIERFKEKSGKKVYVWMKEVAASGGYYLSCGADKIVAMPTTLTGSIGVIMNLVNSEELLKKIGVSLYTIKSGKYKDMGSISRPLTNEERAIFQNIIDESYNQFLKVVSEGRNIPLDQLKNLAQGQVFTGIKAKEVGLIDEIGDLEDTIALVKKDLNLKGEPKIITHKRRVSFFSLLENVIPYTQLDLLKSLKPLTIEYLMVP